MPSKKVKQQPEPDFTVSGTGEVMDTFEMTKVADPLQEQQPPQPQPQPQPARITDEVLKSHDDLLKKARQDRAQQEANRRLNTIHEMEMQIKSQQSREPDRPLKDSRGRTWENYHDAFWQAKRGVIYKDDPEGLNRYLAEFLGETKSISWMDEK